MNPTILVVEDDRDLGESIRDCLSDLFKKSYLATSFSEAIEILNRIQPDVIISDQNIEGGYGIDVLREARAKYVNTVALLETGAPSYELALEAMRLGCVEFIEKPFDADHLHLRVEQILIYERKKMSLLQKDMHEDNKGNNSTTDVSKPRPATDNIL